MSPSREPSEFLTEKLEFIISQLLPGMSKSEFMAWVDSVWEKMDDSYQDFLSLPDA